MEKGTQGIFMCDENDRDWSLGLVRRGKERAIAERLCESCLAMSTQSNIRERQFAVANQGLGSLAKAVYKMILAPSYRVSWSKFGR